MHSEIFEIIESDSYDKKIFEGFEYSSKELANLIMSGDKILPGFKSLIFNIFVALYKNNVVFIEQDLFGYKYKLYYMILQKLVSSEKYNELREETVLDEYKSSLSTIMIGQDFLDFIKSETGLNKRNLLNEWEIDKTESELQEHESELEYIGELESEFDDDSKGKELAKVKHEISKEKESLSEDLEELKEKQLKYLERIETDLERTAEFTSQSSTETIESFEADTPSNSFISENSKNLGHKMDLANKLVNSKKLKLMFELVGSLSKEMLSVRRSSWSKIGSELYNVGLGDNLSNIIPSELTYLNNKYLRADFYKRFLEKRLFEYSLIEDKGRGPFIICVDTSSSMTGDKEIWSKAVSLTLIEIAKRQRRNFFIIIFSSPEYPLKIFNSKSNYKFGFDGDDLIEFAEYFNGGGTNFEYPLNRAKEIISDSKFSKSDIVFITDGEASVSNDWLNEFIKLKKEKRFKVFSILIDLAGNERWATLDSFSEKVLKISDLKSDNLVELFATL